MSGPLNPYGLVDKELEALLLEAEREGFALELGYETPESGGESGSESGTEQRHYGPGPHDNGTEQTVHGNREGSSQQLEREAEAGGFSYSRFAGAPSDGFMVSPYKEAETPIPVEEFDPGDVASFRRKWARKLKNPDHYLGGWRDGDTIYLDIAVRRKSADEAAELARKHGQLAYYDIVKGVTVYVQGAA